MEQSLSEQEILLEEYCKKLHYTVHFPLKCGGMCRFDIKDNRFVKLGISSVITNLSVLLLTSLLVFYILYSLSVKIDYLSVPEILIMLLFQVCYGVNVLNLTLLNKSPIVEFLNLAFEIDCFLGVSDTQFLRQLSSKTYFILIFSVACLLVVVLHVLVFTYVMADLFIYIAGTLVFTLFFFVYYDFSFFVALYSFITLRVRYLNVALMKFAKIDTDSVPPLMPFNLILWRQSFDDLPQYNNMADCDKIIKAYRTMFVQLKHLEKGYRFLVLLSVSYLAVGTFLTVQNFIIYSKTAHMKFLRVITLAAWGLINSAFQFIMTQQTDIFQRQIKQTNLICCCILLDPSYAYDDNMYKLAKAVMNILEVHDPRISIYGMFHYDTSVVLRVGASIVVYVVMQLQLAYPGMKTIDGNVSVQNANFTVAYT